MKDGYVKCWRRSFSSEIWNMPPLYDRVWKWLLGHVEWQLVEKTTPTPFVIYVLPGQKLTSVRIIADGVKWQEWGVDKIPNTKTINTILEWLKSRHMIAVESNAKGTLISVINWATYQQDAKEKVTQSIHGSDNASDTNKKKEEFKEGKEVKPKVKRFVPPSLLEVETYCAERNNNIDAQNFIDHYQARNWIPKGYTRQMSDWKATIRTWEKRNKKEQSEPQRALNILDFSRG
jgi:hypothetical protein